VPPIHRPAPPERPDPAVLLIDAVINRQQQLAQRLGQQWIHRHGLKAFATLSDTRVLQTCGADGLQWLRDQLGLQAAADVNASPAQPPQAMPFGSLIREALREALQPLRQDSTNQQTAQPAPGTNDPWQLPSESSTIPAALPSPGGAPAPADLARLRAWLHSDAA